MKDKKINIKTDDSEKIEDKFMSDLNLASLASKFAILKAKINKIGLKWAQGEIDESLLEISNIYSDLPKDHSIQDYLPLSCLLDRNCEIVRLEFKKEKGLKLISKTTGIYWTEDILTLMLLIFISFTLTLTWKFCLIKHDLRLAKKRDRNRTYLRAITNNQNSLNNPPPYSAIQITE